VSRRVGLPITSFVLHVSALVAALILIILFQQELRQALSRLEVTLQRQTGCSSSSSRATANRTWGEERIASELLLKLGIRVSPRTVRRYIPTGVPPRRSPRSQTWRTFVRNHASAVLACDFFVAITATFRALHVFVVLEVGTRRILHWNMTTHPTADWTAQQFRMVVSGDALHRFVIHDRDSIYSDGVDRTIQAMGLTVLKTTRSVAAGECVLRTRDRYDPARVSGMDDPVERGALACILRQWVVHYRGRPHKNLGPGISDRPGNDLTPLSCGHPIRDGHRVRAEPVLGGLHHEYRLEPLAASTLPRPS
jgi:putative transposase